MVRLPLQKTVVFNLTSVKSKPGPGHLLFLYVSCFSYFSFLLALIPGLCSAEAEGAEQGVFSVLGTARHH